MSIRAGSIAVVAGRNVVDRLQDATLDARAPIETVREIGNDLIAGKIFGEADFNFTMNSWDVTTDMMAFFQGDIGAGQAANQPPGGADATGTEYHWENCQFVNIVSPWKSDTGTQGGHIGGGIIIPTYYPTRIRYRLGTTENASMEAEVNGAEFYYASTPPVEEVAAGTGAQTAFITSEAARPFRYGGKAGATFFYVFGVLVNGVPQIYGTDYTVSGGAVPPAASTPVTITFTTAPPNAAQIRYCYFTEVAKTYPQTVNADDILKPAAVRGRDIDVLLGDPTGTPAALNGVQSFELEATSTGQIQRELGQPNPIGRYVEGTDVTGTVNIAPRDISAFFSTLAQVTGVAESEVYGFINENEVPVTIRIRDPRNAANILKTIYVPDGMLQAPGLPGRVNQQVEFGFRFDSAKGTFSEFKTSMPTHL